MKHTIRCVTHAVTTLRTVYSLCKCFSPFGFEFWESEFAGGVFVFFLHVDLVLLEMARQFITFFAMWELELANL